MSGYADMLKEQYAPVSVLKKTADKQITRLRHKSLARDLICISFICDNDVYKKLMRIRQQNLPCIYDVFEDNGQFYVLEEYIDGMTVSDLLTGEHYTENGVVKVVSQLCDALYALHSLNIIHRDIKPENVIVTDNGRVVLIDFDGARKFKTEATKDTKIMGTVGYAAPEQFGISQTDSRSDIFSLGVMMNVMLTGEHPSKKQYQGKLQKIITKCTQVDPVNRYQTVTELKTALLKIKTRRT